MEFIQAKSILQKVKGGPSWFGTDYNMNLYKGCCHGCIYCDSRSACYGIDRFDVVRQKADALAILRRELSSKKQKGVVGLGSMSDTYNPFEKTQQLTRGALLLLNEFGFGACLATKSALVARDRDVLASLSKNGGACVKVTVTTTNAGLAEKIEPYASSVPSRFEAIGALAKEGVFTGVLLMPVLPFLTDTVKNVEEIVSRAAFYGAKFVYASFGVTLRQNQRDYYYQKLGELFGQKGLVQKYQNTYHDRYQAASPNARRLYEAFCTACQRHGLLCKMPDIIAAYKPKAKTFEQLSLF